MNVDVPGGTLHVAELGDRDSARAPILAIHGITANHRAWEPLAALLPDRRILAPDLRGRGRSSELVGPSSMERHALDLIAALDAAEIPQVVVVGHSMGASVALVLHHLAPERVAQLVLVDGGLPLPRLPGVTPQEAAARLLGPALERLSMTFPDREAYRTFWRAHPSFVAAWSPAVERYVDYDLVGADGAFRSGVVRAAVEADFIDQLVGSALAEATEAIRDVDLTFFRAPRGLLNQPPGLYPPDLVVSLTARFPRIRWVEVGDINHYTILLDERGAALVAAALTT